MTGIADIKMVVLAALIVLTTAICSQQDDKLAQPVIPHAPWIGTQVLAG